MKEIKKYPIFYSIMITEGVSFAIGIVMSISYLARHISYLGVNGVNDIISVVFEYLILSLTVGIFLIYPLVLTCINAVFLFIRKKQESTVEIEKMFEVLTLVLGILFSGLVLVFYGIGFSADWTQVLYNSQVHTPIWTESYLTVIVIAIIGLGGYGLLSFASLEKTPPLVIVTGISALYLGIGLCIIWIIQIFAMEYLILCLLPFNFIIIGIKTIINKVFQWNEINNKVNRTYKSKLLNVINERLMKSWTWPIGAFIFMWPLLGILICVLALFGQEPDSMIKAWTETSDWNLSNRVAPQNIQLDEHYLCTVAAGGHKDIVKPIRLGKRHGHEVIVNRQLCVANAFEQILQERIPKVHKGVRSFYDTYGFPIAKMIHSPYIADLIYIVMKPLEWFFLMVIYFCDVNPENRIAVQYLPMKK